MTPTFPWGDVAAFDDWCREYANNPSIDTLNSLHLCASILYAKLSTFCMDVNSKRMEDLE